METFIIFDETAHWTECEEETWSWEHFSTNQTDGYWIRCGLWGPHEVHEDSHTGLQWKSITREEDKMDTNQVGENVNGTKELIAFFSIPDRPVTASEFMAFWKSCTDEEKDYYRHAKI